MILRCDCKQVDKELGGRGREGLYTFFIKIVNVKGYSGSPSL
jgi:hypothetical protein